MNNEQLPVNQEFPLSFNSYAAFDALSLKQLMKQRLAENGVFTDQVFEGSNFNNLLDIIAYSYNVLLYYLNQTSNESLFSNSQLYENMNKIVKVLNYKPIGPQTSILNFNAVADENLQPGVYTIPRFSYFTINDIVYSFNRDLTFVKNVTGSESLKELSDFSFLYQGKFYEYPVFIGTGEDFEEFNIVMVDGQGENQEIDYNNIFAFVRDTTGYWKEWERVDNIFLSNGYDNAFEIRLNENQRYSLKFGNGVTGKKINAGDIIAVYFLKTDKTDGEVGPNSLQGNSLFYFNTPQSDQILKDIRTNDIVVLPFNQVNSLDFTNDNSSIPYSELEDVNKIRKNATNYFRQQGRLVTTKDIKDYIITNYSSYVSDIAVVDNNEYLEGHIKYLYGIGLEQPMLDSRVLTNQVLFADSCNFNNIYIYCVPKLLYNSDFNQKRGYVSQGLKNTIKNKLNNTKLSTVEIVFQDPMYYGIGLGAASKNEIFNKQLTIDIVKETKLKIVKAQNSQLNNNQILSKVSSILKNYFSFKNTKLGQIIDIQKLTQDILNVEGVESISTVRNDIENPGLTLLGFNTTYNSMSEDISIINQNIKLPYFQIPFWYITSTLDGQLFIESVNKS